MKSSHRQHTFGSKKYFIFGSILFFLVSSLVYLALKKEPQRSFQPLAKGKLVVDGRTAPEVEVLDAASCASCAFAIVQKLRAAGYDVVEFRKAPSEPLDVSCLLLYNNDIETAHTIAKTIGIDEKKIFLKPKTDAFVAVSVIVGKDIVRKQKQP